MKGKEILFVNIAIEVLVETRLKKQHLKDQHEKSDTNDDAFNEPLNQITNIKNQEASDRAKKSLTT